MISDTIAAISTGMTPSGIGKVRLSGDSASVFEIPVPVFDEAMAVTAILLLKSQIRFTEVLKEKNL